ncbi:MULTISPECIES: nucleotide disphospho-sugar-binding domain-containing protein [unclassified Streptomyces]|uniref:nucleotide disphospho-sugar-binding domain-containing protein n=1 Tax=unclassified Streptomyces TaxID=2593676 RepID=UPI00278C6080|nr:MULTISPECIES: nucleotide disphospho-sugar-binding domain-containing protein [unclassified Streptomyces]
MKVLFVGGGSPATIFGLVPFATAVRNAGHQVFMAAPKGMASVISGSGLPALTVTPHDFWHYLGRDRAGNPTTVPTEHRPLMEYTGSWFAQVSAVAYAELKDVTARWRPDVVVGGTMCYAAPLTAARLGVPHVLQAWDASEWEWTDEGARRTLRPELDELGLDDIPAPRLRIEVTPPSMAVPRPGDVRLMRWTPGNLQRDLEPWMYARPDRPRICLTAGSRANKEHSLERLVWLAERLQQLDAEVVVPAPEELAAELGRRLPAVRTGWIPLDVLAPTCDVFVHHAGGATTMTALNAGVPQLIIPESVGFMAQARLLEKLGAALARSPQEADDAELVRACRRLIEDPGYRQGAQALSREIAQLPPPAEFVGELERLAGR